KNYDFIAANFADTDTVGHSGDFEATVKAIETIDTAVGKLVPEILKSGGVMIITADHGNAEEKMYKLSGEKKSQHSTNPIPFYLVGNDFRKKTPAKKEEIERQYRNTVGALTDIAPTVLELLGIKKPTEMTGKSLLEKILE
ncbi:MAG: alkaline phosphatase family protein, partial [Patescibacteria group bacterium]